MNSLEINRVQRCSNNPNEDLVFADLRNRVTGFKLKNIGGVAEVMVDPGLHLVGNGQSSHGCTEGSRDPNSKGQSVGKMETKIAGWVLFISGEVDLKNHSQFCTLFTFRVGFIVHPNPSDLTPLKLDINNSISF